MSAGPSVLDMMANAALYFGAVEELGEYVDQAVLELPIETARANFYAAARDGLGAEIEWFGKKGRRPVTNVLEDIIPLAERGLRKLGMAEHLIDKYMSTLSMRLETRQNGANWQLAHFDRHGDLHRMTADYLAHQKSGFPVHEWPKLILPHAMTNLCITSSIPDGLLDVSARDLHRVLDGPTLIELEGGKGSPLFVSGLMHGNEDSGLVAIQKVLRSFATNAWPPRLPRPLMILIGNVKAAQRGTRRLDGQPDFNRVWPGCTDHQGSDEARIMRAFTNGFMEREAFAAIDIHNNTGRNPHYGVICVENEKVMALASLFAPRAVLFRGLPGTQTASFGDRIPAVTVECGQSGDDANARGGGHASSKRCSHFRALNPAPSANRSACSIRWPKCECAAIVALNEASATPWLALEKELDLHNFARLHRGFRFGETNDPMPFEVLDEAGRDVADEFFRSEAGGVSLTRSVVPAMLTTEERIIRQDCLCYLMEQWPPKTPEKPT